MLVVVARVGSVDLPVVGGLPVATHASNRGAEAFVLLRVDAVHIRADGANDELGLDLETQLAALYGRAGQGCLIALGRQRRVGLFPTAVSGAGAGQLAQRYSLAEILESDAADVDGFRIVAEVEIHVRLAGRVGRHRLEADLHFGPLRRGLDRVFH